MTDHHASVKPAPQYHVFTGVTYFHVTDINDPTTGFIQICENAASTETRYVKVTIPNSNIYNAISLKHKNIARCYSVYQGGTYELLAFEPFSLSLKDICGVPNHFWRYDARGCIIGATKLLKDVVRGVINALGYMWKVHQLSHGKTSSPDSVVFDRSGIPMLTDFSSSTKYNSKGLVQDVRGLGVLVQQLIPQNEYARATSEIKSLICILQRFELSLDLAIIKDHPALQSAKEWRRLVGDAHRVLKNYQQEKIDFTAHIKSGGMTTSNLISWKQVAQTSWDTKIKSTVARVLRQNGAPEYVDSPQSLVKFVRDFYSHCSDYTPNSIYTDEFLEDLFIQMYLNLWIEWYKFFHRKWLLPTMQSY